MCPIDCLLPDDQYRVIVTKFFIVCYVCYPNTVFVLTLLLSENRSDHPLVINDIVDIYTCVLESTKSLGGSGN